MAGERSLGTQENLFAPRQYKLHPGPEPFPSLSHVALVSLSGAIPPEGHLLEAISQAVAKHPMLSRRVVGTGLPSGYHTPRPHPLIHFRYISP